MITGCNDVLEQLLPEGWCAGIEMLASASPFRSCLVEIKQNCIRKGLTEKVLSGTENHIGGRKEKGVLVPKED
jgi:hypothetical protein